MLYFSNAVGFTDGERNRSQSFQLDLRPGLAFRPDDFEAELRPRYTLQTVHNTVQESGNRTVHSYGGNLYLSYSTPVGIVLNSDLSFTATRGYATGFDENRWQWDASIAYEMLRDRSLTLSLKAYDILGQQSNIRRTTNANYIDDVRTNSLGRYVMVTLSYKFNTFGKGNMPQDRNEYRFGPGGPPPGGRPPGGRPPGGRPPF